MSKWTPPKSRAEAEERRLALVERINDINAQLTKFRIGARDEFGNHLIPDSGDFFDWRARAVGAKRHAEAELSRLKLWIKQDNLGAILTVARDTHDDLDPSDPVSLLRALYVLVHRLACEGVDLDPNEQILKDAVRAFLDNPNRAGRKTA